MRHCEDCLKSVIYNKSEISPHNFSDKNTTSASHATRANNWRPLGLPQNSLMRMCGRVYPRPYLLVVFVDVAARAAAASEHFIGEDDLSKECSG